ncbi:hypothetical protein ACFLUF_03145, partial [Chloroflexota bacterium]
MIGRHSWGMIVFLKIYVVIALIIATILSPLALSFVPILLFVWYAVLWWWPITAVVNLLTEYLMFFAIVLLLAPLVGPFFSLLISLPVLLLINRGQEEAAESITYRDTKYARRPTGICLTLILIAIAVLSISLLLGSLSLLLACAVIIGYFGILGTVVFRWLPLKPVEETQVQQRIVAGSKGHLYIRLTPKTKIGGLLFVESPYEWLKVSPNILSLKEEKLVLEVSLSPTLSGPLIIKLDGYTT